MAAISFGELKSDKQAIKAPSPDWPFRIVVLGDFSGRGNRGEVGGAADIASRKTYKVGRDNFDDIMAKIGVQLYLPGLNEEDRFRLQFQSLDDFEPDALYEKVKKFNDLGSDEQGQLMTALLHHPDFRTVESAWRGLWWLLARVKEFKQVQGVLIDVSQQELMADLTATDDLTQTGLYQLLVERPAAKIDGQPWAVLVGLYTFNVNARHAGILGRMAKIARECAAPFLAAVPAQVADEAWEIATDDILPWQALRALPEAALLGLALPGFLLRLPYGENTKSIDHFAYEEVSNPKDIASYLWGNPALLCANLLAQAFARDGWACKAGSVLDLPDMVMHVYTDEDDDRVGLMAEARLTRKEGEKVGPMGFMHFLCARDRATMQLSRFQALAQPPKGQPLVELLGQWGQKGALPLPSSDRPPVTAQVTLVGTEGTSKVEPAKPAAKPPQPVPVAEEQKPAEPEETPAEEAAHEEEAHEELAPAEANAEAAPSEEEMDPELAAQMKQLESGETEEKAEEKPAAEEHREEAGEEEMDPELAALMKQLEEGSESSAEASAKKEDKKEEQAGAEEEMDPELAALMKQLEEGSS